MNSKDGARRSRRSCLVIAVALSFTLSASICSAQAADRSEGATGDGKVATPGLDSAPAAPGADASAAGGTPAASAPGDSGNAGGASQAAQASAADKDDKAPQLPNVDEAFSNLTQSHQAIEPA